MRGCPDHRINTADAVLQNYIPVPESGCWLWLGPMDVKHTQGYGRIRIAGRSVRAHRFFYEQLVGQIPDGMSVCHKCDTRCCVNPDHLFVATNEQNTADKVAKNRQARGFLMAGKLTEEDVKKIRALDMSLGKIAKMFNVHLATIGKIKQRKLWKHVDELERAITNAIAPKRDEIS